MKTLDSNGLEVSIEEFNSDNRLKLYGNSDSISRLDTRCRDNLIAFGADVCYVASSEEMFNFAMADESKTFKATWEDTGKTDYLVTVIATGDGDIEFKNADIIEIDGNDNNIDEITISVTPSHGVIKKHVNPGKYKEKIFIKDISDDDKLKMPMSEFNLRMLITDCYKVMKKKKTDICYIASSENMFSFIEDGLDHAIKAIHEYHGLVGFLIPVIKTSDGMLEIKGAEIVEDYNGYECLCIK